jgi:hypothetical protein
MMTRCSATACSCSIWPLAPRSQRPAARWACTARPTTTGSAKSTATGSRCCARASAAARRCPTSCRRWSRSASSPSRSPIPATVPGGLRRRSRCRSGAAWACRRTASGAACAATASRRAPGAWRSWPATAPPTSHPAGPSRSRISRPSTRASWSAWTASTSGAYRHRGSGLAAHRDRRLLLVRLG